MPKAPPTSVYKLYLARQLKNGVKLAEAAKLWKTQVTEAEKQALAVDLKKVEANFKKDLMAWAKSNNITASESPKEVAQAYCEANGIFLNPGSSTTELLSSSRPSLDDTSTQDPLRLWLGGLPPKTTEYAVLQLTRQFGQLADFYFPVHKFGDARGSTVGYCFITYKSLEDAEKALKGLNGLNFHGHTLVARQAHPTRDELTMIQLANKEAMGLWIAEQAKLREAELAARLAQVPDESSGTQNPPVDTIKPAPTITPTFSPLISNTDVATGASNVNSFRPIGSTSPSVMLGTSGCKPTTSSGTDKRAQIRKIELALRQLENAPIGGVALLRPSSATQRSLIPPGILASRSTETPLHNRMGSGLKRTCSGLSTFGGRSGSNYGQRRQRQRRF
ncbi:probable RNA-binding protein 18 [Clonorchis sinensis]|nr:probable RNA-binding protein 18 [Clonorchis sinensis]